jgi:hypothetical protein
MKPDVETLKWLKNQLSTESIASTLLAKALKMDFELTVQNLRNKIGALLKKSSLQNEKNSRGKQDLADEELIALAKKPYADFLNSAIRTMKSEMTYEEKYEKIKRLTNGLEEQYDGSSTAFKQEILVHPEKMLTFSIVIACSETVLKSYNLYIRNNCNFNALIAAIDIYLVHAKTGQLPDVLPNGLPKDPYTLKDFKYVITKDGFALYSQGKDFQGRLKRLLEFKVKK